jgi:AraC-like DNA-binding protein
MHQHPCQTAPLRGRLTATFIDSRASAALACHPIIPDRTVGHRGESPEGGEVLSPITCGEPALAAIPGGITGFQSAISDSYFPYHVSSVRSPEAFESAAAARRIGPLRLSRTYVNNPFTGGRVRATRGNECNAYVLMVVEEGSVHLRGRRSAVANSGDLILLNADHPVETYQEIPGTSLAMSIPAPMLRLRYANADDWCLVPLPTSEGASAVLHDCLTTYWRSQPALGAAEYNDLAVAMIHLIGACFGQRATGRAIDSRSMQNHFSRISAIVDEHLTNPDLSADTVASRLGISKSYLFMVMNAANTTLGRFVREQRLERSRQMLCDPAMKNLTISEIAFSIGFQDLSHFSRRFTEKFGRSPRAYRGSAQSEFKKPGRD